MVEFTLWGVTVKLWPSEVFLFFMVVGGVYVFWRATTNKKNPIDLSEMFVWPDTKHTSVAFFLAFWAGLISMWVVVDQELKGKLDNTIFTLFITTLVTGKAVTEGINAWRNRDRPPTDKKDTE